MKRHETTKPANINGSSKSRVFLLIASYMLMIIVGACIVGCASTKSEHAMPATSETTATKAAVTAPTSTTKATSLIDSSFLAGNCYEAHLYDLAMSKGGRVESAIRDLFVYDGELKQIDAELKVYATDSGLLWKVVNDGKTLISGARALDDSIAVDCRTYCYDDKIYPHDSSFTKDGKRHDITIEIHDDKTATATMWSNHVAEKSWKINDFIDGQKYYVYVEENGIILTQVNAAWFLSTDRDDASTLAIVSDYEALESKMTLVECASYYLCAHGEDGTDVLTDKDSGVYWIRRNGEIEDITNNADEALNRCNSMTSMHISFGAHVTDDKNIVYISNSADIVEGNYEYARGNFVIENIDGEHTCYFVYPDNSHRLLSEKIVVDEETAKDLSQCIRHKSDCIEKLLKLGFTDRDVEFIRKAIVETEKYDSDDNSVHVYCDTRARVIPTVIFTDDVTTATGNWFARDAVYTEIAKEIGDFNIAQGYASVRKDTDGKYHYFSYENSGLELTDFPAAQAYIDKISSGDLKFTGRHIARCEKGMLVFFEQKGRLNVYVSLLSNEGYEQTWDLGKDFNLYYIQYGAVSIVEDLIVLPQYEDDIGLRLDGTSTRIAR